MSNAISAHGTLVLRNGTAVGEIRDITPPALTRNSFEVTPQNDSDDGYVIGIRRKGELSFTINMLLSGEATHGKVSGLLKAYIDGTRDAYTLQFPDGATWLFSGYLTNFAPKAPVDGELTADVTIRPTGGTTFTP